MTCTRGCDLIGVFSFLPWMAIRSVLYVRPSGPGHPTRSVTFLFYFPLTPTIPFILPARGGQQSWSLRYYWFDVWLLGPTISYGTISHFLSLSMLLSKIYMISWIILVHLPTMICSYSFPIRLASWSWLGSSFELNVREFFSNMYCIALILLLVDETSVCCICTIFVEFIFFCRATVSLFPACIEIYSFLFV